MLQPLQQEFGSGAIINVSRVHLVFQQIALCINEKMTLAAVDLFAAVVSPGSTHLRGLDRLAVDDCGGRLRRPADRAAIAFT